MSPICMQIARGSCANKAVKAIKLGPGWVSQNPFQPDGVKGPGSQSANMWPPDASTLLKLTPLNTIQSKGLPGVACS